MYKITGWRNMAICGTCRHWVADRTDADGDESSDGKCHCHAPRPQIINSGSVEIDDSFYTTWPPVSWEDFCGEWTRGKDYQDLPQTLPQNLGKAGEDKAPKAEPALGSDKWNAISKIVEVKLVDGSICKARYVWGSDDSSIIWTDVNGARMAAPERLLAWREVSFVASDAPWQELDAKPPVEAKVKKYTGQPLLPSAKAELFSAECFDCSRDYTILSDVLKTRYIRWGVHVCEACEEKRRLKEAQKP